MGAAILPYFLGLVLHKYEAQPVKWRPEGGLSWEMMAPIVGPWGSLGGELQEVGASGPFSYWGKMDSDPLINVLSPRVSRKQKGRLTAASTEKKEK